MLLHAFVFLGYFALAGAVAVLLPLAAGWSEGAGFFVGAGLLATGLAGHAVYVRRADLERLSAIESRLAGFVAELERHRGEVRSQEVRRSDKLVHEMQVLQTLLGQIIARSGEAGRGEDAIASIPSAETLGPDMLLDIVRTALSENRVDLYLQPIVALPSRKPVYYECLSRVRDERDEIIFPSAFLPVAERGGLLGTLDNLLLFRLIQIVRKLGPRRPDVCFFCNISPYSLRDRDFFPQFVDYMLANPELAGRLVFEFTQAAFRKLGPDVQEHLDRLGRQGYRFSLDRVEDLALDAAALAGRHVAFVKIDAGRLLAGANGIDPKELLARLGDAGIAVVAVMVEEESQVLELLDLEAELAQGYLFAEPKPSREEPAGLAGEQPHG